VRVAPNSPNLTDWPFDFVRLDVRADAEGDVLPISSRG